MSHRSLMKIVCFVVALLQLRWSPCRATEIQPAQIVCGMSTALTGPAADLGTNMQAGVLAAFGEENARGGVDGRQLVLRTLDDGYEPSRTVPNMRQLIEKDQVVAVIGNVGTPTAIAAAPIANSTGTPFFGAFTGAGVLRKTPPDRFVVNYRASYAEETAAMVDALIQFGGLQPHEIAFFTQRDGYGDSGFVGAVEALSRHGLTNLSAVTHARYERNTLAVENGLAEILLQPDTPKAVITVGAYGPCAKFIRLARSVGYEGVFLNVSFVGSDSLAESLAEADIYNDSVIVTQVVPHPSCDLPIGQEYRSALRSFDDSVEPTYGSFEGYIAARILIRAFRSVDGHPARESTIAALLGLGEFSLGLPNPLKLSATEHQASHFVWPTILRDGKFVPFRWEDLSEEDAR